MSIASTKSKKGKKEAEAVAPSASPGSANVEVAGGSATEWWITCAAIILIALFVRLFLPNLNPLHHDEGVNAFFLRTLVQEGRYAYDPQNYHGPTLYYFALAVAKIGRFLFGKDAELTTFGIRLVPALFGVGTILLILPLRRYIGMIGALVAATLVALSPGAVYMSRYFIHESLFVFFSLGVVVAVLKFYEKGDSLYLMLASASAALLVGTKETAIITLGVFLIALVCIPIYEKLVGPIGYTARPEKKSKKSAMKTGHRALIERLGGTRRVALLAAIAAALFVFIHILFYSSFFTNYKGIYDSVETFRTWTETGQTQHNHPFYKYVQWLYEQEIVLLLLGSAGVLFAFLKPENRVVLFLGLWAFGILAAYSLIPYKTPWIALNFIVPLAITGGYFVDRVWRNATQHWQRVAIASVGALALFVTATRMTVLNFFEYDSDKQAYVYAHTRRGMLGLVDEIDRIGRLNQTNEQTNIALLSQDYWPLPWYLRGYQHVGYFGRLTQTNDAVVVTSESQAKEVQDYLGGRYRLVGTYDLRPGVTLVLWVRKDIKS